MATLPIILAAVIPPAVDLLKTEIIPWVVKLIDHVVGSKTATNPTLGATVKFPTASTIITALQAALVTLGQASPSSQASIDGAIQEVVTNLQAAGLLTGKGTAVTSAPAIGVPASPLTTGIAGVNANLLLSQVLALVAKQLGPG